MIKYCIFDLDGTLLNTLPTIKHHLNTTLRHFGLSEVDDNQTKRYVGDGAYQLICRALTEQGRGEREFVSTVLSHYLKEYEREPLYLTEIYDGITEMLERLSAMGIKLLVLSNKPDVAANAVVRHYFADRFALVRGAMDTQPLKPDPTSALSLLSEVGGLSEECAFVGDTDVDVKTGANMKAAISVGVLWGFRDERELRFAGADLIVNTPDEITQRIGEINEN